MMGTSEDCSNYLQIKIKGKKRANKRIGALPSCSLKEKTIEAQHINVKVAWHCCYSRHIYLLLKIHIRTHTYLNLWIQHIGYTHQTQKLFRDDDRINLTGLQRYKAVICWSEREMDIYWDGQTSPFMSVELKRLNDWAHLRFNTGILEAADWKIVLAVWKTSIRPRKMTDKLRHIEVSFMQDMCLAWHNYILGPMYT